jgi:hypothetical protein
LCGSRYALLYSVILEKRIENLDIKNWLHLKQKGMCKKCTLPLKLFKMTRDIIPCVEDFDSSEIFQEKVISDRVEQNHINAKLFNEMRLKDYNQHLNLTLVHRGCLEGILEQNTIEHSASR